MQYRVIMYVYIHNILYYMKKNYRKYPLYIAYKTLICKLKSVYMYIKESKLHRMKDQREIMSKGQISILFSLIPIIVQLQYNNYIVKTEKHHTFTYKQIRLYRMGGFFFYYTELEKILVHAHFRKGQRIDLICAEYVCEKRL